ncbi:MAG TPA: sensor domain-containing protein [Solirubrobacteraceae bacterium]|nr:sensor domain-containing protein [Solirubrobacteraceae bacterium]
MSASADATSAPEILLRATERELRTERFLRELAYIVLGLPLGALYLVLVFGGVVLGGLLGAVWIGLPIVLALSAVLWRCARLERRLANRLLDARISPLPPLRARAEGGAWERTRERLSSRAFWRGVTLLVARFPVTVVAAGCTGIAGAATGALLVLGVEGLTGARSGYFGPFAIDPGLGIVLCLLAVPMGVLTVAVADGAAVVLRALARLLLVSSLPAGAPVREMLAQSLGDRSLAIAYWVGDREVFVDERGHYVPLPEAGSDRAWTAVDYEGRRVAAIIHDASLEASPELVQAAAAAASLALDNERLKADLRSRVEELRASRVRLVEASNAARRRVERDLHDGAQQQLVAMAVELRLLRNRLGDRPEATELVDRIEDKLRAALEELRELARGIHPGILTDRGLEPALESLAASAPLPVACEIELAWRPPASVEAVAYFVIAEALTNVLKYAQATEATIRARYDGEDLVVEAEDDGIGGADEAKGTGLQGLRDRVGALDGTIKVVSPQGRGTLVQARIPWRSVDEFLGGLA